MRFRIMVLILANVIALVGLGAFLWWLKQWSKYKARELDLRQTAAVRERQVAALSAVWALLRFLSNDSNEDVVFVEIRQQKFMRVRPAKEFVLAVQRVLYEEGHGLYLDAKLKEAVIYCRKATYMILKAEGKNKERIESGIVAIKNGKYKEEFYGQEYQRISDLLDANLNVLGAQQMTDIDVPARRKHRKEKHESDNSEEPTMPAYSPPYSEI